MDRALGERRIRTVVFCDVAGSTALAERRDPEEWADVMRTTEGAGPAASSAARS